MHRVIRGGIYGGVTSSDQLTNSVVLKHLLDFVEVYGVEFLRAIGASIDEDTVSAAGMVFEEAGAVIDMAVHDDPRRIGGIMLLTSEMENVFEVVFMNREETIFFKAWFSLKYFPRWRSFAIHPLD
ncbi:UNVERIFIED_CONTAM: hypothetical protein Sindi_0661000 [Sesamum indicum]